MLVSRLAFFAANGLQIQINRGAAWAESAAGHDRVCVVASGESRAGLFSSFAQDLSRAWRHTDAADSSLRRRRSARDTRRRSKQEVVMEDSQVVAALSAQLAERIGRKRFDLWFS